MTRYGKLREATAIYGAARNIQARSACEAIRRAVIRGSVRTRGANGHYPHYHLEDVLMLACGYQRRPRAAAQHHLRTRTSHGARARTGRS